MLARSHTLKVLRTSSLLLSTLIQQTRYTSTLITRKMLLLLDWDETLTTHDTLAQISPPEGKHKGPPFKWYSEQYMSDYTSHVEKYSQPKNLSEQLKFLDSFQEVELRSNKRIEEGQLFTGWDPRDAQRRAREDVTLREGVREELRSFLRDNEREVEVGVISVSWSTVFIRAGLGVESVSEVDGHRPHSNSAFPLHYLRSNTLELDPATRLGTGKMSKRGTTGVRTGLDKLREMQSVLEKSATPQVTVYAGDSTTDLACLLAASVGIVLGDNKSLRSTLDKLGLGEGVAEGLEGFEKRLERQGNGAIQAIQAQGATRERLLAKSPKDFFLVRVKDWREGTKVLQRILDIERRNDIVQ